MQSAAQIAVNRSILRVSGLSKWFGATQVLRDFSLDVAAGEVLAIIGPSGSGKSTLLRCINYLERFESGSVEIVGERITGTRDRESENHRRDRQQVQRIRTRVGMVFQRFNLFPHLTVLENLTVGPTTVHKTARADAERHAQALLERVGIGHKAHQLPRQLSGGEQQRTAIARTLMMKPEVLLLDEITSALDPELVGEVLRVVQELAAEGQTMLIVTHEMDFARDVAHRVIMMDSGAMIEEGTPSLLFSRPTSDRTRRFLAKVIEKHRAAE